MKTRHNNSNDDLIPLPGRFFETDAGPSARSYIKYCRLFLLLLPFLYSCDFWPSPQKKAARIGILHSLTGTMAISESALVDVLVLGIDEINAKGGLLGKPVSYVVADGKSDPQVFAKEAERLIVDEQVDVLFGCWTSACRKQVKPVVERLDHLLFYPVQYEGFEQSKNIIYTGATPNQQITPAVKWSYGNLGKRFYLVGSDYIFPRTANLIIRDHVNILQGEVLGERYVPLGSPDVSGIINEIKKLKPDVILNTINGDTNIAFFNGLRQAGITPDIMPVMSFSIGEVEIKAIGPEIVQGNYVAWNYFQSLPSDENRRFVRSIKEKYGAARVVSDPMESSYFGIHLWSQAVMEAGSFHVVAVNSVLRRQSMRAPEGIVGIDSRTGHTWKTARIGRIHPDGQIQEVWTSGRPVRPAPYPGYRSQSHWEKIFNELNPGQDGRPYEKEMLK